MQEEPSSKRVRDLYEAAVDRFGATHPGKFLFGIRGGFFFGENRRVYYPANAHEVPLFVGRATTAANTSACPG